MADVMFTSTLAPEAMPVAVMVEAQHSSKIPVKIFILPSQFI